MLRLFHVLALLLPVASASAAAAIPTVDYKAPISEQTTLVGLECHWRNQTLDVALFDASHPPTRRMDLWSTFDLVIYDQKSGMLKKTLSVDRTCKLGADTYKVRFTGAPGNANVQGRCGAFVSARATVWKNGRKLFDEEMEDCDGEKGIASVRFTPASDEPRITAMPRAGTR